MNEIHSVLVAGTYTSPVMVSEKLEISAIGFLPSPAQIFTVRSNEPVISQLLSGSNVAHEIAPSWHGRPWSFSGGHERFSVASRSPSPPFFFPRVASPASEIFDWWSVSQMQNVRS